MDWLQHFKVRRRDAAFVLVDLGIGGMLDAWTPISSGWIWAVVTAFGIAWFIWPARKTTSREKPVRVASDAEAVETTPGNGWRVARLIMQIPTVPEEAQNVEAIYRDFFSQPHKDGEEYVFGARALWNQRTAGDTFDAGWDFENACLEAVERYGPEFLVDIIDNLKREFPEKQGGDTASQPQDTPNAPWHDDLERCHEAFVKYIREPYEYPIGQQEIAATQAFLPHIVRLCHVLDEHNISHPPLDAGDLTFTGTGEWGDFMARLMAVRGDLEEARKVYPKMLKGSGDD